MELKNKTALITGGTHGIGKQIAISLAEMGVNIAVIARKTSDGKIKQLLEKSNIKYIEVQADLSTEQSCKKSVVHILKAMGIPDIVIHCAGSAAPGGLLQISNDVWYNAFNVHIHALFHICREAVPLMKEKKEGAIIMVSSAAGIRGVKNAIAYSVAKGTLPQFCKSMAMELSDYNIRVNCISPGIIRTRFQDHLTQEQVDNNVDNRIPLHREGTAKDVAAAVLMLLQNDFITGENLVIDGGMTMRIA